MVAPATCQSQGGGSQVSTGGGGAVAGGVDSQAYLLTPARRQTKFFNFCRIISGTKSLQRYLAPTPPPPPSPLPHPCNCQLRQRFVAPRENEIMNVRRHNRTPDTKPAAAAAARCSPGTAWLAFPHLPFSLLCTCAGGRSFFCQGVINDAAASLAETPSHACK